VFASTLTASGAAFVTANGGTLEMQSAITDSGSALALKITGNGDVLKLDAGSAAHTVSFNSNSGKLELNSSGTLTVGTALTIGSGTLQLDGASSALTDGNGITVSSGGIVSNAGLIDAGGTSSITGATITNSATGIIEAAGGTFTIDATSTVTNNGLFEVLNGATLTVNTAFSGNVEMFGTSSLVLGGASSTNITLEPGATNDTVSSTSGANTVNATALAAGQMLTLTGGAAETVTGLQGNLTASGVSGALNVTTVDVSGLSIATGSGSNTINATALTAGHTLTLTGSSAATVTLNAGNLSASTDSGYITVTGGAGANTITVGSGGSTITGGGGADLITLGSGVDKIVYGAQSDSTYLNFDSISGFTAGTDKINLSAFGLPATHVFITNGSSAVEQITNKVNFFKQGVFYDIVSQQVGSDTYVYVDLNQNGSFDILSDLVIKLSGVTQTSLSSGDFLLIGGPAGIAGKPINLALTSPDSGQESVVTVTIKDAPAGWILNGGIHNPDGSWTVVTNDVSSLTVTTPTTYSGAAVLNVTETWIRADGSTATTTVMDNVEAYAPGSPIFALSGDDHLTGSGGNDLFVFAQPIGHDDIYNFNPASDKIDLIGFAHATSFGDIQANLADDANGDAVIALGDGQSITLRGVDASLLTTGNFVFDQTPIVDNAGRMDIGDDAMLPLSGTIDNTGTIALNSIGHETDLQLIGHGVTLSGGGQVILSDNSQNFISGTDPSATLTNVDNTISGAGHLGDGQLTLVNEGTIIANGNNALVIDTGANVIVNSGTLQSTGTGGLVIYSDVANSGLLWADGGNVTVHGNVSGSGSAIIDGSAVLEFTGADSSSVIFHSATGELILDHSAGFTGTISGFSGDGTLTGSDLIDLRDINFSSLEQSSYANGVLTVSDGTHTVNLDFNGDYQLANFKFSADGQGGTTVYDPPVTGESAPANDDSTKYAPADTATTDTSATDSATFLKDTVANFKSDADKIAQSFSDQMQHILNTAHDGHGNAVWADSTDALSATGTKSAQSLQASMADAKSGFESWKDATSDHNSTLGNSANGMLNGNGGTDAFVFKPNLGHDTSVNFNPASDSISIDHTLATDVHHLPDTLHHDVATNAVIAADANTVLHDLLKNQLLHHLSDFHFL
jgi:hypothetical protein